MPPECDSYARVVARTASVLVVVVGLLWSASRASRRQPEQGANQGKPAPVPPVPIVVEEVPAEAPEPVVPAPPAPPVLDRAAVARAEAALDAASRDRARAEARAEEAARLLAAASAQAASDASSARQLAYRVRDPSARVARASARGGFLRAERDRLKGEVAAIQSAPRPKAKLLADKNPVAKPAGGEEYHFEVRRNRVAFIDLQRLIELVKADAQVRIRLSDRQRLIESQVGPVGAFALQYVLGRSLPGTIDELIERRSVSFDLRGWEIVPEFEGRGETYEMARKPISEFTRAVNRLNPSRATVTMWVYPDGFALYRKLRDDLHARGYLVAARPLPEGAAIRGSPAGSLSAGQ
jgi:hypothetical protein